MHTNPIYFDYFAREAIVLLNLFEGVHEGVQTAQSCSGHIQEGDQKRDDPITHYTPGFKHYPSNARWDSEKGCVVETPERFEVDGVPVTLADLKRSTYHRDDMLLICPLEDVYEHEHKHLKWTGSHLLFSQFDTDEPRTRELGHRLDALYNQYKKRLGLHLGENRGFHGHELVLSQEIGIAQLVEAQRITYMFWKEMERVCLETPG
jgi:hypothetical protein